MDPTQDTRTDEELIKMCQEGDLSAFELIVRRWDKKVLNLAYRLIGDEEDAKDVRQQTFINVYRSIASFNGKGKASTWLYRIAINLCKNELDKKRRKKMLGLGELGISAERLQEASDDRDIAHNIADPSPTPCELMERRELSDLVRRAVCSLPMKERTVVVLRQYEGLSFREIAELLGCPVTTVKSRMGKALERLKARLRFAVKDDE